VTSYPSRFRPIPMSGQPLCVDRVNGNRKLISCRALVSIQLPSTDRNPPAEIRSRSLKFPPLTLIEIPHPRGTADEGVPPLNCWCLTPTAPVEGGPRFLMLTWEDDVEGPVSLRLRSINPR
jgi:hypothetical protein